MITLNKDQTSDVRAMWLAVSLAAIAGISYILIGQHMLAVGDLQTDDQPATIIYVAAASYLLGGLLILLQRRWLWIAGALINAMVILVFISFYIERPAVMFSPGGLVSKAAQLLLEAGLIYLIVTDRRHADRSSDRSRIIQTWRKR